MKKTLALTEGDTFLWGLFLLGFLMDMFQTPILPELSLNESEEQFEVFCKNHSEHCWVFFQSTLLLFSFF